ncbi:MAG: DUF4038 domain-containing protein [Methylacidiphilales bacterium]|nr:DUF4038 domain-containing protein [Candidatus Methylacidiphilales bacterium]
MNHTSRRSFLKTVGAASLALVPPLFSGCSARTDGSAGQTPSRQNPSGINHQPLELTFVSTKQYHDPYNEATVDVVVSDSQGKQQVVPAFWAGGQTWKMRYASRVPGRYTYRVICSDTANSSLHGKSGTMEFSPYKGTNPLFLHGPVRVSNDLRHFEHEDGTPFFWLGDTWWFGLCKRFGWPSDFHALTEDRRKKGYTVIQITSGLNPEDSGGGAPPFDPRSMNEAGYAWEDNYARINPKYFDLADQRIQYLVENGLLPCVVGAWGYHLPAMGVEKMNQHWRYLIARWGALPVVWCLAGELTMPYWPPRTAHELEDLKKRGLTITDRRKQDSAFQKHGWTEVARYVRQTDPYRRLFTVHPRGMQSGREQIEEPALLDFEMLQASHDEWWGMPGSIELLKQGLQAAPKMPVLIGEIVYEGLQEHNRQDVVRFAFWTAMLTGAAGHTYGAGGIFEMESAREPYGLTPDGDWHSYLDPSWDVAAQFPGAQQVAWGKQLLSQFEWWRLEPHPEWVEPHASQENIRAPYAAAIPGELYVVYLPILLNDRESLHQWKSPVLSKLDPKVTYDAFWFCPSTAKEEPISTVQVGAEGTWAPPVPEEMVDWVLVVAKRGMRKSSPQIKGKYL